MFRMFEKRESETENDEGKYDAHFRLKNWGIMVDEDPCKERIQVSSDLEQVVVFWLVGKNLVKLETIYITGYLMQAFL